MVLKPTIKTEFVASWNDWDGAVCVTLEDYEKLEQDTVYWMGECRKAWDKLDNAAPQVEAGLHTSAPLGLKGEAQKPAAAAQTTMGKDASRPDGQVGTPSDPSLPPLPVTPRAAPEDAEFATFEQWWRKTGRDFLGSVTTEPQHIARVGWDAAAALSRRAVSEGAIKAAYLILRDGRLPGRIGAPLYSDVARTTAHEILRLAGEQPAKEQERG